VKYSSDDPVSSGQKKQHGPEEEEQQAIGVFNSDHNMGSTENEQPTTLNPG